MLFFPTSHKFSAYVHDEGVVAGLSRNYLAERVLLKLGAQQTWDSMMGLCGPCAITGEETAAGGHRCFSKSVKEELMAVCNAELAPEDF